MLTQTSIAAIRLLVHLGLNDGRSPASLRQAARELGGSSTYLAKIARQLAKAGILRTHRGAAGGVVLNSPPSGISLLDIVQACQGTILGDFCNDTSDLRKACAFHQASAELHQAILNVLSRWKLADLLRCPRPTREFPGGGQCWMQIGSLKKPAAKNSRGRR